jgi:hypothetical protein
VLKGPARSPILVTRRYGFLPRRPQRTLATAVVHRGQSLPLALRWRRADDQGTAASGGGLRCRRFPSQASPTTTRSTCSSPRCASTSSPDLAVPSCQGSRPGAAGDLEPRQLGRGAATRQGRPTHRQAGRLVRPGCPAGGPTAPSSRTCGPPRPGRSASPTSDYDLSNHRPLWAQFKTPTLSTPGRRGAAQHRQAGVACAAGQGYHPRPAGGLTSPTPGAPRRPASNVGCRTGKVRSAMAGRRGGSPIDPSRGGLQPVVVRAAGGLGEERVDLLSLRRRPVFACSTSVRTWSPWRGAGTTATASTASERSLAPLTD